MRYKEFHTILLSKIKHKISVTVSPVQNLPQRRLQLTSTQLDKATPVKLNQRIDKVKTSADYVKSLSSPLREGFKTKIP